MVTAIFRNSQVVKCARKCAVDKWRPIHFINWTHNFEKKTNNKIQSWPFMEKWPSNDPVLDPWEHRRRPYRFHILLATSAGEGATRVVNNHCHYLSFSYFEFKIRLIRSRLGLSFQKQNFWYSNWQPTDSQSEVITITPKSQLWVGDTEKLSVTFSHARLITVQFT